MPAGPLRWLLEIPVNSQSALTGSGAGFKGRETGCGIRNQDCMENNRNGWSATYSCVSWKFKYRAG